MKHFCIRSTFAPLSTLIMPMQPTSEAQTSASNLRARLVTYDELRPCTTAFIDTRTPGSAQKENFTIIGPGVAENPDQHVHITEAHGFNIGGARQPPGCVNSQHSHETEEVFVVHSGTWAFRTGENGQDGEVILTAGDVISIPTRVFRGFENVGNDTGFLFAVLGRDDPGHVLWAPYVFEQAEQYGLVLMESGRLIDTTKGETVPEGERVQEATTETMMKELQVLNSKDLESCVFRRKDFKPGSSQGLMATDKLLETPIIGSATRETAEKSVTTGKLAWPHGFQLRHLTFSPDASTPLFVRAVPEVIFVQSGEIKMSVGDDEFTMGPGDVFTTPVGITRRLQNASDTPAEVYVVLGTDNPSGTLVD